MQDPTQEEKNQAMEDMECWSTQNHLKECRKCQEQRHTEAVEELEVVDNSKQ